MKATLPRRKRELVPRKNQRGEMQGIEATQLISKRELKGMLHKLLVDLDHGN